MRTLRSLLMAAALLMMLAIPAFAQDGKAGAGDDQQVPDNQQSGGGKEMVTKTFELTLNGTVPEGETFVVRFGVATGEQGNTGELFLCGEGAQDACTGDGTVYSDSIEVPSGAQIDFEFERAATGEVFHEGNETITEDMTNTAFYMFGKGTGAGDDQQDEDKDTGAGDDQQTPDNQQDDDKGMGAGDEQVPDNQQDGEDKDTDTGAGDDQQTPDNQQDEEDTDTGAGDDTQDDVQDDQQGEMPEELPETGAGALASGATIPVGSATAGMTMLLGAGYAVLRRP